MDINTLVIGWLKIVRVVVVYLIITLMEVKLNIGLIILVPVLFFVEDLLVNITTTNRRHKAKHEGRRIKK